MNNIGSLVLVAVFVLAVSYFLLQIGRGYGGTSEAGKQIFKKSIYLIVLVVSILLALGLLSYSLIK